MNIIIISLIIFFLSLAYASGKLLLDMVRKNGKKILTLKVT